MELKRKAIKHLEYWRTKSSRKPLIIRGARQVGKTTLVRQFGKGYKHSIYLNLELEEHLNYFQNHNDVRDIVQVMLLDRGIDKWKNNDVLLFIDEIQASPKAILLLRYFHEFFPNLHVIAAGSLLEFALTDVKSFPVGRVEFLYLHPLDFEEFLMANGNDQLLKAFKTVPMPDIAHESLKKLFHLYAIVGGMPEVVKHYFAERNLAVLPPLYESAWEIYRADMPKYAEKQGQRAVLDHLFETAPFYLDKRIKFQHFGNSNYKSKEIKEAFSKLQMAKIVKLIYPSTSVKVPIVGDFKKSPRMQFLDTGLVNHALGIQGDLLALEDLDDAYRGALIRHLLCQEWIAQESFSKKKPNFWVREKKQSSAEVDLLRAFQGKVIPVEVKSGPQGKLRSLHEFIKKAKHPYTVRFYSSKLTLEKYTTAQGEPYFLLNLPYYLAASIDDYLAWFLKELQSKSGKMD